MLSREMRLGWLAALGIYGLRRETRYCVALRTIGGTRHIMAVTRFGPEARLIFDYTTTPYKEATMVWRRDVAAVELWQGRELSRILEITHKEQAA